MAEKIADVRAERDELKEQAAELATDLGELIESIRLHHEDAHTEVLRYCAYAPCQLAGELEQAWSEVLS